MGSYANDWHSSLLHSSFCDAAMVIDGAYGSRIGAGEPLAQRYRVRKQCQAGEFATVTQALAQWRSDKASAAGPCVAIIEIADSDTYHEAPALIVAPHDSLHLRAADQCRPVLRMSDYQASALEGIAIRPGAGSRLTLEGITVAGGPLALQGDANATPCQVVLRDCTLVPGWCTDGQRTTVWRSPPSIMGEACGLHLSIHHSVVGGIHLGGAGNTLHIQDSIVDAGHAAGLAICDHAHGTAPVRATIVGTTIMGVVQVQSLNFAGDSIFQGALLVERRDSGSVRQCYLAPGSRTPRERASVLAAGASNERQLRGYRAVRDVPRMLRTTAAELRDDHAGMRSACVRLDRSERVDQVLA